MAILSTLIPACVFALTLNPSPTGLALIHQFLFR